jgi:predicted Fe-S protein YdhL (DUF1289 family)
MSSNPDVPPQGVKVPSPCSGICRLDERQLCVGCRRSIDEIVEWPRASVARQLEILRELALRTGPEPGRSG